MRHSAGSRLRGWSEFDAAVATGEGRRLPRRRRVEPRWRPSAIAGAHGIEGMIARATTATATVVSPTANITSPVTGAQLSLRSRSDASYAASSSTGATKQRQRKFGRKSKGRRGWKKGEQCTAERQEHRIRCSDAACYTRQNHGGDEQTEKLFELSHIAARSAPADPETRGSCPLGSRSANRLVGS